MQKAQHAKIQRALLFATVLRDMKGMDLCVQVQDFFNNV